MTFGAKALIDSLLYEMPRHLTRKPEHDRPRITYTTELDGWNGNFLCKATAILSSGETKVFKTTVPMTPEQRETCKTLNFDQAKRQYPKETKQVYDEAVSAAREWIEKNDEPYVMMDQSLNYDLIGDDLLWVLKGFRYVVGNKGVLGGGPAASLAALANMMKPGDKVVQVTTRDHPQDFRLTYFVVVNPAEGEELHRRAIEAKRKEVSSYLET